MSMRGFKAHIKSRQRAGEISFEDALRATPIEVKVLDAYLTVASTETVASASRGEAGFANEVVAVAQCPCCKTFVHAVLVYNVTSSDYASCASLLP